MSGVELAACPFCGGEARLWMPEYPLNVDCGDATVSCLNCDADGPSIGIDMDVHTLADWPVLEAEAIAAWNRRGRWRFNTDQQWTLARDDPGFTDALTEKVTVQALALIPQAEETVK